MALGTSLGKRHYKNGGGILKFDTIKKLKKKILEWVGPKDDRNWAKVCLQTAGRDCIVKSKLAEVE